MARYAISIFRWTERAQPNKFPSAKRRNPKREFFMRGTGMAVSDSQSVQGSTSINPVQRWVLFALLLALAMFAAGQTHASLPGPTKKWADTDGDFCLLGGS